VLAITQTRRGLRQILMFPAIHQGNTMTSGQPAHIEPSRHSTDEVDAFLDMVEDNVDVSQGAGSPAIKPNKDLDDAGKPLTDTPKNPRI